MSDRHGHEKRLHAEAIMREIVNPLEAANNLAYLLSISASDATSVAQYVEMLQVQLARLNDVVQRALGNAKTPE